MDVVDYKPEESVVGDVNLRRAMWYAVDNDAVGKQFYDGFRWAATTLIAPSHSYSTTIRLKCQHTIRIKPMKFWTKPDMKMSMETDSVKTRWEPVSYQLCLHVGGDIAEPLANYYIQSWQAVGLNVQLLDGRLHEFNTFYDRVGNGGNDDPEVHVLHGSVAVGSDVDPGRFIRPTRDV